MHCNPLTDSSTQLFLNLHTTEEVSPVETLLKKAENADEEFYYELLTLHNNPVSTEIWEAIYNSRLNYHFLAVSFVKYALTLQPEEINLVDEFRKVIGPCEAAYLPNMAQELYLQLDYSNFTTLAAYFPAHPLIPCLIDHLLTQTRLTTFRYLFRAFIETLATFKDEFTPSYIQQLHLSAESKYLHTIIQEDWHYLSGSCISMIAPILSLESILHHVPHMDACILAGVIHAYLSSLDSFEKRESGFKEILQICRKEDLADVFETFNAHRGSPALIYFLTETSQDELASIISTVPSPILTRILESIDTNFLSSHPFLLHQNLFNDAKKLAEIVDYAYFSIRDNENVIEEMNFKEYSKHIKNALQNCQEEGEILYIYREQIQNFPPLVYALAAGDSTYHSWLVSVVPYLTETALEAVTRSLILNMDICYQIYHHLLKKDKYNLLKTCFLSLPPILQKTLLNETHLWVLEKQKLACDFALDCGEKLNLKPCDFVDLQRLAQQVVATRWEIAGPLGMLYFHLDPRLIQQNLHGSLEAIKTEISNAQESNKKWLGPEGLLTIIRAGLPKTPIEDRDPLEAFTPSLLDKLTVKLLNDCNLENFTDLFKFGLLSDQDFGALGLIGNLRYELDNIEIRLNQLHPSPSLALYNTWEHLKNPQTEITETEIESLTSLLMPAAPTCTKQLEEILLKILNLSYLSASDKSMAESLLRGEKSFQIIIPFCVNFLIENSFSRRLQEYLAQTNLEEYWADQKTRSVDNLSHLLLLHPLLDLYRLTE